MTPTSWQSDPHWAPPTGSPAAPPPAPPPPRHRTRAAIIAASITGVVALAIGGVVLLGGNDHPLASTTTIASTTTSSTTSTTSTTVAPTTTVPMFTGDDLAAALPGAVHVPADWSQYSESDRQHDPDADGGICLGPNSSSLAEVTGSIAGVDGPTFDLPDGGWFGIEAYAFESAEVANEFVMATMGQASCTEPVTWQVDEANLDVFRDGFGDSAVWDLSEVATVTIVLDGADTPAIDVAMRDRATTEVDGTVYSYRFDELVRYEQYGTVVVLYWLDGQYEFTGFSNQPDWIYQPTTDALWSCIDAVRDGIMTAFSG